MDQDRTLNDDALEREIEHALAVDPSPEFLARLRTRIANEPRPVSWHGWRLVGVGALAGTLVLAFVINSFKRDTETLLPSSSVATTPISVPAQVAQTTLPPAPAVPAPPSTGERARAQVRRPVAEPEILIPPGEAAALRLLVMNIREGRIDASKWDDAAAAALLEPITEIVIRPISIEPLPQLALVEGERP